MNNKGWRKLHKLHVGAIFAYHKVVSFRTQNPVIEYSLCQVTVIVLQTKPFMKILTSDGEIICLTKNELSDLHNID